MKPREAFLTHEILTAALDYDPETGVFRWKVVTSNRVKVGDAAGFPDNGYVRLSIYGSQFMAHRLAWFYVHGQWPDDEVDHISMDRSDNRIANLRPATKSENMRNRPAQKNNKVGLKGVCEHKQQPGKYTAQITQNRKKKHLGVFTSPEEGHQAYVKALSAHHKEYGRSSYGD